MLGSAMPSLDFSPQIPSSPLLPLCQWRGFALNHFQNGEANKTQDVSHLELDEALGQIYPKLGFAELARLYGRLTENKVEANLEKIFTQYGFGYDQRLLQCLELFRSLPAPFQAWVEARALSPRDILPLASLLPEQRNSEVFSVLAKSEISRSYGVQILELAVDLILLEHSGAELAPPSQPVTPQNVVTWIDQLKTLRYPQTTQLDQNKEHELSKLPWTKDFKTKWQRQGDHSGLEVRFNISSKADFAQKIETLERILGNHDE